MSRRKKAVKGLESELIVQLKLVIDPNLIVFTPVGGLGPIDIITLNLSTGEYTAYDAVSYTHLTLPTTPYV